MVINEMGSCAVTVLSTFECVKSATPVGKALAESPDKEIAQSSSWLKRFYLPLCFVTQAYTFCKAWNVCSWL